MKTTINGQPFKFEPRHDETAIDVLRDRAGLTGTKMSCGGGIFVAVQLMSAFTSPSRRRVRVNMMLGGLV